MPQPLRTFSSLNLEILKNFVSGNTQILSSFIGNNSWLIMIGAGCGFCLFFSMPPPNPANEDDKKDILVGYKYNHGIPRSKEFEYSIFNITLAPLVIAGGYQIFTALPSFKSAAYVSIIMSSAFMFTILSLDAIDKKIVDHHKSNRKSSRIE